MFSVFLTSSCSKIIDRTLYLILALIPVYAVFYQVASYANGNLSIDFAIFTQSIERAAHTGALLTSLLNWQETNLLTHHFCPILYLPVLLTIFGVPAELAGILMQSLAFYLAAVALVKIAQALNVSSAISLLLAVSFLCLPTVRAGLLWEIHEELLALPLIGFSFYALVIGRPYLSCILFCCTFLCKEIFPYYAVAFSVTLAAQHVLHKKGSDYLKAAGLLVLAAVVFTVLYEWILPDRIFHRSFLTSQRIADLQLINLWRKQRLIAILMFLLPFLIVVADYCVKLRLIPRLSIKSTLAFFTSFSTCFIWILMLIVSGFLASLNPDSYYPAVPTMFLLCSLIIYFAESLNSLKRAVIAIILFSFFLRPPLESFREILFALDNPNSRKIALSFIPADKTVITSDWIAPYFIRQKKVVRVWHANQYQIYFDYLVLSKHRAEPTLAPYLTKLSELCYSDQYWEVYCRIHQR